MEAVVKLWWPMIWAAVLTIVQIVQMLLTKTYAKCEDVQRLDQEVQSLKQTVRNLPSQEEVNQLRMELANTRGELKELRAELKPLTHLSQLLLEQHLNGDR